MSESESSSVGLFAFPISDTPLLFHRFLYDYWNQLGRVSGNIIHWRPIGDPAQSDDEYRKVRTPTLEKRDQEDSAKFKEEVSRLGSKDWLCQREYQKYSKLLDVEDIDPPLVVFTADPLRRKAILKFELKVFDRSDWTRELADIFIKNLSAKAFSNFREDGVFTDGAIEAVQQHLWEVGKKIFRIYTSKRSRLPAYLKIGILKSTVLDHIDPSKDIKLWWWLRKDKSLAIDTAAPRNAKGKVDFPLFKSTATKQQNLMLLLLHNHPNPVSLGKALREIYPELSSILGGYAKEIGALINRVRALVTAIRKKLNAGGIPKEILPSVNFNADKEYKLRLNVAEVHQVKERNKGKHDIPYVDTKLPKSNLHKDI